MWDCSATIVQNRSARRIFNSWDIVFDSYWSEKKVSSAHHNACDFVVGSIGNLESVYAVMTQNLKTQRPVCITWCTWQPKTGQCNFKAAFTESMNTCSLAANEDVMKS